LQTLAETLGAKDGESFVSLATELVWLWKEKEVHKILGVIEKHKATITITLALTGDTRRVALATHKTIAEVSKAVKSIEADHLKGRMKTFYKWLDSPDPNES